MARRFLALSVVAGAIGCGGSGSPTSPSVAPPAVAAPAPAPSPAPAPAPAPAPSVTTFQGTFAGTGGQGGTYTAEVQSSIAASALGDSSGRLAVVSATGTLTLTGGGGTFALTGTFDTTTNAIALSGSGFALSGTVADGGVTGTYTAPNSASGRFAALDATRNTVTAMCGTWSGSGGPGTWNLQVSSSGAASGVTTGGAGVTLRGQLNGTALTMTSSQGVTATGVVQNGTVTGTFTGGSFSGSTTGCR